MNRLSLKIKLRLFGLILVAVSVLIGAISYLANRRSGEYLDRATHIYLPAIRQMGMVDMMHDGLRAVAFRALLLADAGATAQDKKEKEATAQELSEFTKTIRESLTALDELRISPAAHAAIADSHSEITAYVESAEEIVGLALMGRKQQALAAQGKFQSAFENLEGKLDKLSSLLEAEGAAVERESTRFSKRTTLISLVSILFSVVFGGLIAFIVSSRLNRGLESIIDRLMQSSEVLTQTSDKVRGSARDISNSASTQSHSVEQTSTALEEISSMVAKTSENAQFAAATLEDSQRKAEEGKVALQNLVKSVADINQGNQEVIAQITSSNQQLSEITRVIQEIDNKTKVINEIVFQTKLLSFNASVEAARAGEHGKGFAVVAEEVGNLAQMSGTAAKEISDLLSNSIAQVEGLVAASTSRVKGLIETTKSRVDLGHKLANQNSEILNELFSDIAKVTQLSKEISLANNEQTQGVSEINRAMNLVDSSTKKNSESIKEFAEVSESLSEQADLAKALVANLIGIVRGAATSEASQNLAGHARFENSFENSSETSDTDDEHNERDSNDRIQAG